MALLVSPLALAHSAVFAQDVPSAVDPGQLQRALDAPLTLEAPAPAPLTPRRRLPRPADADGVAFVLRDVRIVGNERLDDARLRPLVESALGDGATLADLYDVADRVTAEYRRSGFILSQALVPAQTIADGTAEIRVVEGFVDRVEFGDMQPAGHDLLAGFADRMVASRPLDLADLERNMLLMNDLPGLVAESSVGRSEEGELGAARLRVATSFDPVEGSVALNNRGSERVGPGRVDVAARVNGRSARHPQIGARALFATDAEELGLFSGFADIGLGRSGERLRLSFSALRSEPDLDIVAFGDLESVGTTVEATWSRPLLRSRLTNRYIDVGFKAFDSDTEGQAAGDELGTDTETKTRQVFLGLRFDSVDAGRGINQLQLTVAKGIDGLGASDSRAQGASPQLDFTKASLYAARLQALAGRTSILIAGTAQVSLSGDDLPTSETFGVGGQEFVRAYDASELTGPAGGALKLELRYAAAPILGGLRFSPYGFYDIGAVTDSADARSSLSSAGVGTRLRRGALGGYAELAVPLDGEVAARGDDDPRFFAGLSFNF